VIRKWLRETFRKSGYDIHRYPTSDGVLHREHISKLLGRLQINCVFDVGAHIGEFGSYLRALGYRGRIVSFEPVSTSFERLAGRAKTDRDWFTYNCALGETICKLAINVSRGSDMSSFLRPTEYCIRDFESEIAVQAEELVCVSTLDDYFGRCTAGIIHPRVFLKTDTQGYDLKVIRGAERTLPVIAGLQTELSVLSLYSESTPYLDAIRLMTNLGFELTGLFAVNRDKYSRVIEFDCIMINRALCKDEKDRHGTGYN
jgi:FkbM family methyltransferase